MITIHTLASYQHQYPRPQVTPISKKDDSGEKQRSFEEILKSKMELQQKR